MKNQVVHIFRKDIHQHWREIALSFAIIVAYAWPEVTETKAWPYIPYAFPLQWELVPLLVVVSWAFLILRSSHAECLVGDRQFWVTRPYEWKQLLAAKLLFVAVFVNVPLLILQVFLLVMDGYKPTSHIPGLLGLQLLWLLCVILPVMTLATVTASIGQFMLVILGWWLSSIALGILFSFVPAAGVLGAYSIFVPTAEVLGVNSISAWLGILVVVGAGLAVVPWQYARRRTKQSRLLLLSAGAVVAIFIFAIPYRILVERTYPQATAGQQLPVQLAFDPAKPASNKGGYPEENEVHIRIPLLVSGIANGYMVTVAGTAVSIQAPGGHHWSSGWRSGGGVLLPNRQHDQCDITMAKDFFERVKSSQVKVQIAYALAPAHARETIRTVPQGSLFTVPGEGRCFLDPISPLGDSCVFPLKAPMMLVSVKSDEITCALAQKEAPLPPGTMGYGWVQSSAVMGTEFGIDPFIFRNLEVRDWGEVEAHQWIPHVCPGTPLTIFTDWKDLQRTRIEIEIDDIRLADYQLNDALGG
jgi:hypothetical protein